MLRRLFLVPALLLVLGSCTLFGTGQNRTQLDAVRAPDVIGAVDVTALAGPTLILASSQSITAITPTGKCHYVMTSEGKDRAASCLAPGAYRVFTPGSLRASIVNGYSVIAGPLSPR